MDVFSLIKYILMIPNTVHQTVCNVMSGKIYMLPVQEGYGQSTQWGIIGLIGVPEFVGNLN